AQSVCVTGACGSARTGQHPTGDALYAHEPLGADVAPNPDLPERVPESWRTCRPSLEPCHALVTVPVRVLQRPSGSDSPYAVIWGSLDQQLDELLSSTSVVEIRLTPHQINSPPVAIVLSDVVGAPGARNLVQREPREDLLRVFRAHDL